MKAFYEVQTFSPTTGAEHWVRVEANDRENARRLVAGLGEKVGEARLVEMVASEPSPPMPGVVICPDCQGTYWDGGRSLLVWLGIILLFPIGLLFLLVRPTWRCTRCGYTFDGYTQPVNSGEAPRKGGIWYLFVYVLLASFVGLCAFIVWWTLIKP